VSHRVAARASGFLTLIHTRDGPERYGAFSFFEIKPQMAGSSKQFAAVPLSVFDVLMPP